MSCGMCGNDMRLSTDPKLMDLWQADDDLVCWACAVQAILRRTEREKLKKPDPKKGPRPDDDPESLKPHYEEGRIFTAVLLDAPLLTTALEVTV